MTSLIRFSPALIGLFIVVQAGLNRRMAVDLGIAATAFLSSLVLFVASLILLAVTLLRPEMMPAIFRLPLQSEGLRGFSAWHLVPGLFGLPIVVGTPWAIAQWGAAHTVMLIVSAQLLTAAVWDVAVEGIPLSSSRAVGIGLAWAGVVVASGVFDRR